uniref:PiggyBac transposable element-derived protein domain-containing protein n=1 Tax=Amphimedon queenslandica TaxID=400682 RepID=A0A1X7TU52_AMPQE
MNKTDFQKPVYVDEFTEHSSYNYTIFTTKVFLLLFTSAKMEYIIMETNSYASRCMGEEKYEKWERISSDDMNAYFGIMIIMGLTRLLALSDYWHRDPLFHCSIIANFMTRDRSYEIN